METDKDLLRQGRYAEVLGENYCPKPYYILHFKNGPQEDPLTLPERFYSAADAMAFVESMLLTDIFIGNINDDWL